MKNKVILAYSTSDGTALASELKNLLAGEVLEISEDINEPVDIWDTVAVLFILTPDSISDANLISFAQKTSVKKLPLTAVVADLESRLFEHLPDEIKFLTETNIISLRPDDRTPTVLQTVSGYLGLQSFAKDQKVFISYRRKDSHVQADALYNYLWSNQFTTFIDINQIEGGVVFQKRIVEQISDKDLVLVIDSPNINSSFWVMEEIVTAFTYRIPVCVVKLQDDIIMPLLKDVPQIKWEESDTRNLEKIKLMISRRISYKESFDSRIRRTLQEIATLKDLTLTELARRRYIISKGRKKILFEYENNYVSLERLHRLFKGLIESKSCTDALFVGGDLPVQALTVEAVNWARGKSRLEVLPLVDLYGSIDSKF
jgi:hypothetical protein